MYIHTYISSSLSVHRLSSCLHSYINSVYYYLKYYCRLYLLYYYLAFVLLLFILYYNYYLKYRFVQNGQRPCLRSSWTNHVLRVNYFSSFPAITADNHTFIFILGRPIVQNKHFFPCNLYYCFSYYLCNILKLICTKSVPAQSCYHVFFIDNKVVTETFFECSPCIFDESVG